MQLLSFILCIFFIITASATPDRLFSKRHSSGGLSKRGSGFTNGGSSETAGWGADGQLKNKDNYAISFYHINDVHAWVSLERGEEDSRLTEG